MSRRSEQDEDLRFRLLREIQSDPNLSQRQIADRLGISLGRANYCLRALVEKGSLKLENFRASDDKRRYLYLLTPHGVAEKAALTSRFLSRKLEEHALLTAEIAKLQAEARDAAAPESRMSIDCPSPNRPVGSPSTGADRNGPTKTPFRES